MFEEQPSHKSVKSDDMRGGFDTFQDRRPARKFEEQPSHKSVKSGDMRGGFDTFQDRRPENRRFLGGTEKPVG